MAEYAIVIDDTGGFAVEVRQHNAPLEVVSGFQTEAEANQYMQERLRRDDPGNDFA